MSAVNLHATALALAGAGLLIRGPSGSGKSSLAVSLLRRATAAMPVRLVADDQVLVRVEDDEVRLLAPAAIAGLIEVRGVGLLRVPFRPRVPLRLVVDLCERETIERLPEPETASVLDRPFRLLRLPARDPAFGADVLATLFAHDAHFVLPAASEPAGEPQ